jgi:cellulose synthase/poly-beta-1,6-N-acetylglucosamine synthase-like glycosyltransferase
MRAQRQRTIEARWNGTIILFTDDDCVPTSDWLAAMIKPFDDPEVVGVKGVYRTRQKAMAARFVQIEYEDRYRLMADLPDIDFIDTYSAGFRRDRFLEMSGYDNSFPVACAEDIELSYRMSARGWKMKFVPSAIVYHTHPDTLSRYLKKKYKFAFWRMLALRKNPNKALKDSHTPQVMKLQLLFAPALLAALGCDLVIRPKVPASLIMCAVFLVSTIPFTWRAIRKDPTVGLFSPFLLAARAGAQLLGVVAGLNSARAVPAKAGTESRA